MSWDVVLFNSSQKIETPQEVDPSLLIETDFCSELLKSFKNFKKSENHIELIRESYSIELFCEENSISNTMLSLYGEDAIYALVEIAKKHNWQIYDTGLDAMIHLDNPQKNGYLNHKKFVEKTLQDKSLFPL